MASADLVTVQMWDYWYNAGTPHGYPSVAINLNYDITKARFFDLEDLFVLGSDYLERISRYCIETLWRRWAKAMAGLDTNAVRFFRQRLEGGASPSLGNFKIFTLDPTGLIITFDVYQVSTYADGTPKVTIPYTLLQPVLRPGSIVDVVRLRRR